jgi:hypothetical protein
LPKQNEDRYEKQSCKNWFNRNNRTTYILLWVANAVSNHWTDRTRCCTFSSVATLAGTLAVCVFWNNADNILVADITRLWVQMRTLRYSQQITQNPKDFTGGYYSRFHHQSDTTFCFTPLKSTTDNYLSVATPFLLDNQKPYHTQCARY